MIQIYVLIPALIIYALHISLRALDYFVSHDPGFESGSPILVIPISAWAMTADSVDASSGVPVPVRRRHGLASAWPKLLPLRLLRLKQRNHGQ
jgi:hypothetical protein